MMPYHSLALLAILAPGFLWLLGEYMTTFATFVQSFIGHVLLIGFFLLLIQYSTMDDGKVTRTIHFNCLGSSVLSLVAPLPIHPTSLEEIELMQHRYPSESLLTDSRDLSPTASLPIGADIGLQTDMESAALAKMLDPI